MRRSKLPMTNRFGRSRTAAPSRMSWASKASANDAYSRSHSRLPYRHYGCGVSSRTYVRQSAPSFGCVAATVRALTYGKKLRDRKILIDFCEVAVSRIRQYPFVTCKPLEPNRPRSGHSRGEHIGTPQGCGQVGPCRRVRVVMGQKRRMAWKTARTTIRWTKPAGRTVRHHNPVDRHPVSQRRPDQRGSG